MKKILILQIFLLLLLNIATGQKENNHWFFGENCGLVFNPTTTAIGGNLNTFEGCATISNNAGDLLFYTDGSVVYNRNMAIMTNGTGLLGHSSSASSAVIVPQPGSKTDFFIFTVDQQNGTDGLNYSVVDMDDDGNGQISPTEVGQVKLSEKNVPLPGPDSERISVVKKSNDIDYWIITTLKNTNRFYVHELTNQGVNPIPSVQPIGTALAFGYYMKASPDGTKIALGVYATRSVYLFDFNKTTGQVSNRRLVGSTPNRPYGIEFSPNSEKMYYSDFGNGNGTGTGYLYQVDVSPTLGTPFQLAAVPNLGGRYALGALQLTPENPQRILVAKDGESFLAAINNPNVGGAANFEANAIALTGICKLGFPTFISGNLETDPVCEPCYEAKINELDICVEINSDANHPLASLDCDDGGVINLIECSVNGNPSEASDDCANALTANVDLCALINNNPEHPLAYQDCDNGGVPNWFECLHSGNVANPSDDCTVADNGGLNICKFISYEAGHPLASLDCDNGGVDNYTECMNAMDPNTPSDDCTAAVRAKLDICAMINGNPNHPWANLDCDRGGIPNITECNNGADPTEPIDDLNCPPNLCAEAIVGNLDICVELSTNPSHPVGPLDCDGDGVTNADECIDNTDPLDPCDFVDTSITLPVTADQSGCPFPCPDLTPIVTVIPGNISGYSPLEVAVEVAEIENVDTDGSVITVRMPSDPRLVFVWDIGLTLAALVPVQNADWNYLGSNGVVHTWTYNGPGLIIDAMTNSAFGFQSFYNPQSTDGQTTITATIIPFGGGECNVLNNSDSERMVYFE